MDYIFIIVKWPRKNCEIYFSVRIWYDMHKEAHFQHPYNKENMK